MAIQGVGLQSSVASGQDRSQQTVSDLERQKQQLQRQLKQVEQDKTLTDKKRQEKVEKLEKQISGIDEQIQNVRQKAAGTSEVQTPEERQRLQFDTLEKSAQAPEEQQDNTYRLEQDENGLKVLFNRRLEQEEE